MTRTSDLYHFLVRAACTALAVGLLGFGMCARAQDPQQQDRNRLKQPVYRTANAKVDKNASVAAHPLDPALARARDGLRNIRENVRDYTCTMVKRERIGGVLLDYEYMYAKIRNQKSVNGRVVAPFSVYLYFLKPAKIKGREVLYVRGANNGKLYAHEPRNSLLGKFGSVWLHPDGKLAMKGNRYPITEIGLETLVLRLIEKGVRDKQNGHPSECKVEFFKNSKVNKTRCTLLQVTHPYPRDYYDFHVAQIFIDEELNVPVRYAAYSWPADGGKLNPENDLIEEYTYLNLKLNVGLTDEDFDPKSRDYRF